MYSPVNTPLPAKSRTTNEGPFGEVLRATGPMAKANPRRFSTKYQDDETGLCYYGYRYYDSSAGRWLDRDLLQEAGGLNVYCFVGNSPIVNMDVCGLDCFGLFGRNNTTAGGSVTLSLFASTFYITTVSRLSYSQIQEVVNGSDVQTYGSFLLKKAKSKWICGGNGKFVDNSYGNLGLNDNYHPSTTMPWHGNFWRVVDWGSSGTWHLFLAGSCTWQCGKAVNGTCSCTSSCSVNGSISKYWTFAPVPGGNSANKGVSILGLGLAGMATAGVGGVAAPIGAGLLLGMAGGQTIIVDQPITGTFNDVGSKNN